MKNKLKSIHPNFWIALYLFVVLIYTLIFWLGNPSEKIMLDSNELGDFLAGVFAPIAFLYLFLGYKQQEKALNKTNQDLLKQLKLQESMLELQIADQRAKEHAALPILDPYFTYQILPFDSNLINESTGRPYESFKKEIILIFKNSGEKVSQVAIKCISPLSKTISFDQVLTESKELKARFPIKESTLDEFNEDGMINLKILLSFVTSLGIRYEITYEIKMSTNIDSNYFSYGGIRGFTKCNQ